MLAVNIIIIFQSIYILQSTRHIVINDLHSFVEQGWL